MLAHTLGEDFVYVVGAVHNVAELGVIGAVKTLGVQVLS